MASKTDVCNLALLRIGVSQQLTNVDTDGTREALSCLILFNEERDFVLRDFAWQRARAYTTPAACTNASSLTNNDWAQVWRMPADCLYVRRIVTANGRTEQNPPPFAIGRDPAFATAAAWSSITAYVAGNLVTLASVVYECILLNTNQTPPNGTYWRVVANAEIIYTNMAPQVIEYTAQITDPAQWEAEFISMFAWRMGASLSLALSRTQDMAKTCLEMYAAEKQQAQQRASLEGQKDTIPTDANAILIINAARRRLGITVDTEPKTGPAYLAEMQVANDTLIQARDYVLRDFPWPWARAYADPVLFAGDPNAPFSKDWIYGYIYPVDCFYVRRILNPLERADYRRRRQYQWGGDAMWPIPYQLLTGAFGTITIGPSNVADGDTVTIDGLVYTFTTTLTGGADEVLIGADAGSSALHLGEAINGGPNAGTDFASANSVIAGGANGSVLAVVDGSITSPPASTTLAGSVLTIAGVDGLPYNWSKSSSNITLTPSAHLYATRLIVSNEPSIAIEYTRVLANIAEFYAYDTVFNSMLTWRLVFEWAPSRITDPKRLQSVQQTALAMYEREKSQAQRAALTEQQQQEPLEAEWIRGR